MMLKTMKEFSWTILVYVKAEVLTKVARREEKMRT